MPLLRNYGWQSIKLVMVPVSMGIKMEYCTIQMLSMIILLKLRPRMLMKAENWMVFVVRLIVIVISHCTIFKLKGY